MNEEKEMWLAARMNAITENFDLPEKEMAKVNAVFDKMRAIAEESGNQGEFEQKLMSSPVTQEYNNLFQGFAPYVKGQISKTEHMTDSAKEFGKGIVKGQLRNGLMGWIMGLLPDWITDWWIYRENNIPGVGKIKSAKNQRDQTVGRVQRGYDNMKEQEELEKKLEEERLHREEEKRQYQERIDELTREANEKMYKS